MEVPEKLKNMQQHGSRKSFKAFAEPAEYESEKEGINSLYPVHMSYAEQNGLNDICCMETESGLS